MMEEKKYYSVDRLEGGLAVLLSDEDEALTLSVEEIEDGGPADGQEELPAESVAAEERPAEPEESGEPSSMQPVGELAQKESLAEPAQEEAPLPEQESAALPSAAANKRPLREGDILVWENGRWRRDDAEAARRRKKNAALLANLRRRSALK